MVFLPEKSYSSLPFFKQHLPSVCHSLQHWPPPLKSKRCVLLTLLLSVFLPQWVSISYWIPQSMAFSPSKFIWKLPFPLHISLLDCVLQVSGIRSTQWVLHKMLAFKCHYAIIFRRNYLEMKNRPLNKDHLCVIFRYHSDKQTWLAFLGCVLRLSSWLQWTTNVLLIFNFIFPWNMK